MYTLLAAIFVLGVLVFIHEFGHFLAAKIAGIRVERFSLGFPPKMIGKKIGETEYCISWIPLGGYVKLAGMIDESLDKKSIRGEPWEFQSKPLPHRFMVITSGPIMNYLLSVLLFSALIFSTGVGYVEDTTVGEVIPGFPAEQAGIQAGDKIVAVDGQVVEKWEEMTQLIHSKPDQPITIEWVRETGERFSASVKTRRQKAPIDGQIKEVGMIGIGPRVLIQPVGPLRALKEGFGRAIELTRLILFSIKMIITGEESLRSLGGPILIAKLAGESARSGWGSLFGFMAFLSINLAILNILPLPVLDGGHLVFLVIEAIIRRPVSTKVKMVVQQVGMVLLIALILFVIFNDLRHILGRQSP